LAVASVLSMTTVGSYLILAAWVLGNIDGAGAVSAFGGFSADGSRYLLGKDQVCEPLAPLAASGTPRCEKVTDRQTLKGLGFQKPRRQRRSADGTLRLVPEIVDERRIVVRGVPENGAPVELVAWDAGGPIAVIKNLAPSGDGGALAVEYVLRARPEVQVVGFRLRAAPPPPVAPPPVASGGNAYARALAGAGKWEQRLVACDQAGVTLALTKQRKFDLAILTKCQGEKWTTKLDGTWLPEGNDTLVLTFQNEGAPDEKLACTFKDCDGRDCLACTLDDLAFTLLPKR
jgi:hypothetical protein